MKFDLKSKKMVIQNVLNELRHILFSLISVVLKDVSDTVMSELLQFMYEGVVHVKRAELEYFMKIAQMLQIKGLATSSNQHQQQQHHGQKSPSSPLSSPLNSSSKNPISNVADNYPMNLIESKINLALYNSTPSTAQKQSSEFSTGGGPSGESSYHKRHLKRASDSVDNDISTESMENISSDDVIPIPQISMIESSRFDLLNVKREANESLNSPGSIRNPGASFNFDYHYNKNNEYPNDIHMNNDLMKGGSTSGARSGNGNHMEIPPGKQITQFLSYLLLVACIFFPAFVFS